MRRVIGRRVEPVSAAELAGLAEPFERVVVDVGTGDGQAILRRARREPSCLFIGVDAVAENMRAASHRAGRPPARGGVDNALFLVAGADDLPGRLAGVADEVTVVLPWGSLLRSLLQAEPSQLAGLRGLLRAGGRLELLLSVAAGDTVPEAPPLDAVAVEALAESYRRLGLAVEPPLSAEAADVERLGSSWARRLGIPRRRQAWLLVAREPAGS